MRSLGLLARPRRDFKSASQRRAAAFFSPEVTLRALRALRNARVTGRLRENDDERAVGKRQLGAILDAGRDAVSFGGSNIDGAAFIFNNLTDRTFITSIGSQIHMPSQTTNFDNGSGTIAVGAGTYFGIPIWTNDNATLTITNAATVYIEGLPLDSTRVNHTNEHSLLVAAGVSTFGGTVSVDDTTDSTSASVSTYYSFARTRSRQ